MSASSLFRMGWQQLFFCKVLGEKWVMQRNANPTRVRYWKDIGSWVLRLPIGSRNSWKDLQILHVVYFSNRSASKKEVRQTCIQRADHAVLQAGRAGHTVLQTGRRGQADLQVGRSGQALSRLLLGWNMSFCLFDWSFHGKELGSPGDHLCVKF